MDPYMVIGVRRDAAPSEIRAAYRRLAKENHPDRFIGSSPMVQRRAQRKMSELNVAYRQIGPRWRVTAGDSPHAAQQRREEIRRNHRYQRWEAAERAARARADAERDETLRRGVEEEQRAEEEQQRAERPSDELVGRTARARVRKRPETIHGEGISGAELHQQIADLRAELAGRRPSVDADADAG